MRPPPEVFASSFFLNLSIILVIISTKSSSSSYGSGEIRPSFDRSHRKSHVASPVSSLTSNNRRPDADEFPNYRNFRMLATTEAPVPFIEPSTLNTSVYLGQTASLPCVVKHLGDKTVSWIRGRDLHILTSGVHVYTNDRRVQLTHHDGKVRHLWTLNIREIARGDEGVYECQLNTEPKLTSLHYLHVLIEPLNDDGGGGTGVDAQSRHSPLASLDSRAHLKQQENAARILGPSLARHRTADSVHFTCLVPSTRPTTNVTWFLNDVPIERSSVTRGGFRIESEVYTYSVMSKLIIFHVYKRDEGKYSCGGLGIYPASITLIVDDDSKDLHQQQQEEDIRGAGYSSDGRRIKLQWIIFIVSLINANP